MLRRKILRATLSSVALLIVAALFIGCCVFSSPRYSGPKTDHFDDSIFKNLGDVPEHGFSDFLEWRLNRDPAPWPEVQDAVPGPKPPERVESAAIRLTFVNHATVLVQQDGINVLTDPIWSERSSPVSFAGPKRIRPPGIRFEDLPPIDVVLISHNHYDHLDIPTLLRIAERWPNALMFVGLGNAELLRDAGIRNVNELDWWHERLVGRARIVAARSQHFSGRSLCDRDRTLWTAWAIISPAGTTYFAGDTGYGSHFAETRSRLGPIRAAILPIGAYAPEWFMGPVHTTPAQAVRAAKDLQARASIGMHFGTFPLADEGPDDPPRVLAEALAREGSAAPQFWVLGFGEGRDMP